MKIGKLREERERSRGISGRRDNFFVVFIFVMRRNPSHPANCLLVDDLVSNCHKHRTACTSGDTPLYISEEGRCGQQ
jgi:hypothetical protein